MLQTLLGTLIEILLANFLIWHLLIFQKHHLIGLLYRLLGHRLPIKRHYVVRRLLITLRLMRIVWLINFCILPDWHGIRQLPVRWDHCDVLLVEVVAWDVIGFRNRVEVASMLVMVAYRTTQDLLGIQTRLKGVRLHILAHLFLCDCLHLLLRLLQQICLLKFIFINHQCVFDIIGCYHVHSALLTINLSNQSTFFRLLRFAGVSKAYLFDYLLHQID